MITAAVVVFVALFVIIVICRVLAGVIRQINRHERGRL